MARKPKEKYPEEYLRALQEHETAALRSRITAQELQIQVLQAACLVARTEIAEARAQGRCQLPAWAKTLEILEAALDAKPEPRSELAP